ncbi:GGDEF domain-containing protein [Anaerovorax odorimutans]|uniref:GGDEF domain-containing protein n=1 Tax=Anaerovorax odorimutans TaxID=109327 RepID=UPI0004029D89|nr:GGDEF domain-containing protein [Anaerovorax odorimutans]
MNQADIQLRLYRAILLAGASLSIISIIGNYFTHFPFLASVKWIVLFFITVVAFILSNKKYSNHIMFGVFIFLNFIFLPFAFINSGGSNNNAMGYIFLLLIAITYLFKGWRRNFLIITLIIIFMVMHALEYYYPQLILIYTGWNQFVDRMLQIPLLLFAAFLIILQFSKEYERVNKKLKVFANFDELTGLYNRRMFNKAMEEAEENNNKFIHLALIDIDNFKEVNDKHGHYVGDEVLKRLSFLLQNTFELDKHIVSRWGGDEFAIIYYGEKVELIQKMEEIRESFRDYVSAYEKETKGISMSIVSVSDYDKVSQSLIEADHLLYKEKEKKTLGGKDQKNTIEK